MPLTPEAKSALSTTIRSLRKLLLRDLMDHVSAVYRLQVPFDRAGLGEAEGVRRRRLEGWLDERVRGSGAKGEGALRAARDRFLCEAVREAAATLVNRLVYLRLLEHMSGPDGRPLRRLRLVTGGWSSAAMAEFRDISGPLRDAEGEGFDVLLDIVFDDLAVDLPGLFGPVGVTPLIPIPAGTLRHVVEALDVPALASAWDDDTTFGWVYQYWNDPAREDLDKKIKDGGKIEPHEIASKTQMFTERYMVEWLLQNSLGPTWLAMCHKHGWTAEAECILPGLEDRRAEWRARREAGEVALDALMPIAPGLEDRWKYYVPQDIPAEAVAAAPESLRGLKLLDPACGSGHFLVIACDLLFALCKEEARHRGEAWTDRDIVESIVANNLHGIDIDPRAVQIAAAALLLKARTLAPDCRPPVLNLVAPAFDLSGLPDDDPALVTLLTEVERETGLPASLTRNIVRALAGASHLGTLLKVEHAVTDALLQHQVATGGREPTFDALNDGRVPWLAAAGDDAERLIAERLETFLANHTGGPDLGLRLDGEQLAAGVRFMRLVRPGTYHVVLFNPPYLGADSLLEPTVGQDYPAGKADIYAAMIARSLHLAASGGLSAFVAKKEWMFNAEFKELRDHIRSESSITVLGDLQFRAFDEARDILVAMAIIRAKVKTIGSIAIRPSDWRKRQRDLNQVPKNIAGLCCQAERFSFSANLVAHVPEQPIIYWWSDYYINKYRTHALIGSVATVCQGISTGCDPRFVRFFWEVQAKDVLRQRINDTETSSCSYVWAPLLKGGAARAGSEPRKWIEPLRNVVNWKSGGLGEWVLDGSAIRNPKTFLRPGVAFTAVGTNFLARAHRFRSICHNTASSVFPPDGRVPAVLMALNSADASFIVASLNPGVHFEVGDVRRLPDFDVAGADAIYATLDAAFTEHEAARETSVEFRQPGPSAWTAAQAWAQRAVDRPAGEPLPDYVPVHDPVPPVAWVSYAFGQAMGRFGRDGQGILDNAPADAPDTVVPHGILFLSAAADRSKAEKEYAEVAAHLDELTAFLDVVATVAEDGPPPTGPACPARAVSAPLDLDLDDGVMINAAALWPLLAAQGWKDPAKWWEELANAKGRKAYDWSKLAARYWPYRVDEKCQEDPSLAVAHGCFWRYHPARAYAWELRLQDEIRPDFTIDEAGSDDARAAFLAAFPDDAEALREKERKRREKKAAKGENAAEEAAEDEGDDENEDAMAE